MMSKGGVEITSPSNRKSVTLRKVENGYTVDCYDEKKSRNLCYIAENLDKAQEIMDKLLS